MLDFNAIRNDIANILDNLVGSHDVLENDPLYADEIIAYLFLRFFGEHGKEEVGAVNINAFNERAQTKVETEWLEAVKNRSSEDNTPFIEYGANSKARMAYTAETLLNINTAQRSDREHFGLNIPPAVNKMVNNHQGRIFDAAQMIMLHDMSNKGDFDLLSATLNGTIINPHTVSEVKLANMYEAYNQRYEQAKNEENIRQYIYRWIDLFRCEARMHYTLINDVADYILDNQGKLQAVFKNPTRNSKNEMMKREIPFSLFFKIWGDIIFPPGSTLSFLNGGVDLTGRMHEAYQVLRHKKYIPRLFSCTTDAAETELSVQLLKERGLQWVVYCNISEKYRDFFLPFLKNDPNAEKEIYDFCKNSYPIIDSHKPLNFYKINKSGNNYLYNRKIKIIRRIMDELLDVKKLAQYHKTK